MEVKKQQQFRIRLAFDSYRVGDLISPTGLYRSSLISRGFIEPVIEQPTKPLIQSDNSRKNFRKASKHDVLPQPIAEQL
jgi:hypothetical protein